MAKRNKGRKARRAKKKEALLAQPDVAVTIAVATPEKEKKYGGGSMMVPPERAGYPVGGVIKAIQGILRGDLTRPLSAAERGIQHADRHKSSQTKDMAAAGAVGAGVGGLAKLVVVGGYGWNKDRREAQALLEAGAEGEIDASVITPDERINPEDFPTYVKGTDSANAFQDAFRQARELGADTFEFEGRTYTTDLPVDTEAAEQATEELRGGMQEGGSMLAPPEMGNAEAPVDTYPNIPPEEMAEAEASQLPDEQMEDEFIDFVLNESLTSDEQMYLMNTLEDDPQLSVIFDKVVGTASEFTGSGEVTGPGTGVSDSIPARLSDGEFVMTRKATDQIGADNLQVMMDEAERAYDGGLMRKDEEVDIEDDMNKVMRSSNQMPSLNVRQR